MASTLRVQQNAHALDCRGRQDDKSRPYFGRLARLGVHNSDSGDRAVALCNQVRYRPIGCYDDLTDCNRSFERCPEIRGAWPLSSVRIPRRRNASTRNDFSVPPLAFDNLFKPQFRAREPRMPKTNAVRQLRQTLGCSLHAKKTLDAVVRRAQVPIAEGPRSSLALIPLALKFIIRKPEGDASPSKTSSADLPPANPKEALWTTLHIRMFVIVHKKVRIQVPKRCVLRLNFLSCHRPGLSFRAGIFRARSKRAMRTSLQNQNLESRFAQLLCCPAATDAGAHHHGIVGAADAVRVRRQVHRSPAQAILVPVRSMLREHYRCFAANGPGCVSWSPHARA